jgi:hypothetical protein
MIRVEQVPNPNRQFYDLAETGERDYGEGLNEVELSAPALPWSLCRRASDNCQRKRDVCYTLMNRHRQLGWLRPLSARTIRT